MAACSRSKRRSSAGTRIRWAARDEGGRRPRLRVVSPPLRLLSSLRCRWLHSRSSGRRGEVGDRNQGACGVEAGRCETKRTGDGVCASSHLVFVFCRLAAVLGFIRARPGGGARSQTGTRARAGWRQGGARRRAPPTTCARRRSASTSSTSPEMIMDRGGMVAYVHNTTILEYATIYPSPGEDSPGEQLVQAYLVRLEDPLPPLLEVQARVDTGRRPHGPLDSLWPGSRAPRPAVLSSSCPMHVSASPGRSTTTRPKYVTHLGASRSASNMRVCSSIPSPSNALPPLHCAHGT